MGPEGQKEGDCEEGEAEGEVGDPAEVVGVGGEGELLGGEGEDVFPELARGVSVGLEGQGP